MHFYFLYQSSSFYLLDIFELLVGNFNNIFLFDLSFKLKSEDSKEEESSCGDDADKNKKKDISKESNNNLRNNSEKISDINNPIDDSNSNIIIGNDKYNNNIQNDSEDSKNNVNESQAAYINKKISHEKCKKINSDNNDYIPLTNQNNTINDEEKHYSRIQHYVCR